MSLNQKVVDLLMAKQERYPEAQCYKCPLLDRQYIDGYVESNDLDNIEAIYVAEHPGQVEMQTGIPLTGQAGQCLQFGVEGVGGDWQRSYRTNAVMCVPHYGEKITRAAMDACLPRLKAELSRLARRNPDAKFVALGKIPAQSIHLLAGLKLPTSITPIRGSEVAVPALGARFFVTFNPAYILRQKQLEPIFVDDLSKALYGKTYPFPKLAEEQPEVRYCLTPDRAVLALESLTRGPIAWDIESSSVIMFDQRRHPKGWLTAFAITDSVEHGYILTPDVLKDDSVKRALKRLFEHPNTLMIAHNGKFDKLFMRQWLGMDIPVGFDTMLAHYILDENTPQDLKWLSRQFLGVPDYERNVLKYVYSKKDVKKMKFYDKVPFDVLTPYAVWDVCCTWALYHLFEERLIKRGMYHEPFIDPVMMASNTLTLAEERGLRIDFEHFKSQSATVKTAMAELILEMRKLVGDSKYNPNSWVQTQPIMYDLYQFPKVSGKTFKAGSTSKDAIKKIEETMKKRTNNPDWSHPFLELKKKYSRVAKINSAYINPLPTWAGPVDGRVHTTFYLHVARTGRLSSRDPALQVIPRPTDKWGRIIRSGFIAAEGMVLGKADYSQAELRTLAVESLDEYLIWCYNHGIDLHTAMAETVVNATPQIDWPTQIMQPRSVAKIVNFGYAYDAGPAGLSMTFPDLIPYRLAKAIHDDYNKKWRGAAEWKVRTKDFCYSHGYVETCFGRRRRFPVIAADNKIEIGRQAVNFPIQSIASDLTLKAANRLSPMGVPIVLLVHDEIMFEAPPDEAPDMLNLVGETMVKVAQEYSDAVVWKADGSIRDRWAAVTPEGEEEFEKVIWNSREGYDNG